MKNLLLLFIAFLVLSNLTFAQWKQLQDMPAPRCWAASCTIDGKIYVVGGSIDVNSSLNDLFVYDPVQKSWDTLAPMPTSRVEFCTCEVNGKIYAIGGAHHHSSGTPYRRVEEYDPLIDEWFTKTSMPTPLQAPACGVIGNKIYVAGGAETIGYNPSNILLVYDPATDEWTDTLMTMDFARYHPRGVVLNDKFYVTGGLSGPPWPGEKTVQIYDPATNEWSQGTDMPEGRVGHTANVLYGYIYAIGGDTQPPPVDSVAVYNPNTSSWTRIFSQPDVMILHTASVVGDTIYVFGGSTTSVPNLTATSSVYSFDVVVSVEDENNNIPENIMLYQNYPNPFNPSTKIRYSVPQLTQVMLKVYDVLGNEIETLVNQEKQSGTYEITWYAENLPSGVYFYRLQAGNFVETKKMILLL